MASSLDPKIKTNLIKLRNDLNLSQIDLADQIGISRNTYRNIEVGKTCLVHKSLDKIARHLGVSPEGLILGYEPLDVDSDPRLEDVRKNIVLKSSHEQELSQKEITRLIAENYELKEKVEILKQTIEAKDQLIDFIKKGKK